MYPKDHVAISVGETFPENKKSFKLSLKTFIRTWRRIPHLQKKLIILLISVLFFYFVLSSSHSSSSTSSKVIEDVQVKSVEDKPKRVVSKNEEDLDFGIDVPHQLEDLSPDKRKHLDDLVNLVEPDVNALQNPLKRPPPKLIKRGADVDIDQNKYRKTTTEATTTTTTKAPEPPPPFIHLSSMKRNEQQEKVVSMFNHAWKSYKKYSWGHDHLHPISHSYDNWFGIGLTLIDSLDTMYIMGLEEPYLEARDWVARKMNMDKNQDVNLFECTIRVLGSLLSAFHISGDQLYKDKAIEIGERLLPALQKSKSPIPYSDVNLHTGKAHDPRWGPDSTISEVTSIQLEFRDLSFTTKDNKYQEAADRISDHVAQLNGKKDGLVPMWINANTGRFRPGSTLTMGARADSYYEYLLKKWIQTGQKEEKFLNQYLEAISAVQNHLIEKSIPNGFTYVGELLNGKKPTPKMDHLVCFLPGTLALGSTLFNKTHAFEAEEHMKLAKELIKTCYEMYRHNPTGLSAEITHFNDGKIKGPTEDDIIIKKLDRHNLLRPETVESLFYMWRITKDQQYRDWGWKILLAFEKYTKVKEGGYTSINNVADANNTQPKDKMESFFLGETLKYLYLLFSDDESLIDLNKWVFNTEAHPLPIRTDS